MVEFRGSEVGEKSLVGAPLPKPEGDESQVHEQEDKSEKKNDAVKPCQETDGVEPSVVSQKIPSAHRQHKNVRDT